MHDKRTSKSPPGRLRWACGVAATAMILAFAPVAPALTPVEEIQGSPDTWVDLSGSIVEDHNLFFDGVMTGTSGPGACAPLCAPDPADLDAVELVTQSTFLASYDITVEVAGGLILAPGDVALGDFDTGTYTMVFDASAAGLPAGVNTDAVALAASGSTSSLLLSFDTTVTLGGVVYDDDDLVLWSGGSSFSMALDGSAAGLGQRLDIDGAYRLNINGNLLLSFDTSGSAGGVSFDDEDVLEYTGGAGTWEMAYDGSAAHAGWGAADMNALGVFPSCDTETLVQTMVAYAACSSDANLVCTAATAAAVCPPTDLCEKAVYSWTEPVSTDLAIGTFGDLNSIQSYNANLFVGDFGVFPGVIDTSVPPAPGPGIDNGLWYLVKPGCPVPLASWQTSPGAEPGRDVALP